MPLTKKKQFEAFSKEWAKPYAEAKSILRMMQTYQPDWGKLKVGALLKSEEMDHSQIDWLARCSQYEGMKRDFYKPWWVPIEKNGMGYFMDLSDRKLPVFKTQYIPIEPYSYCKQPLFDSAPEMVQAMETGFDADAVHERQMKAAEQALFRLSDDALAMVLEGNLPVPPPAPDEIFNTDSDAEPEIETKMYFGKHVVTYLNVSPMMVALLPYDLKIKVENIAIDKSTFSIAKLDDVPFEKLKCVRDLVYVLRKQGMRVLSYSADTADNPGDLFIYTRNMFTLVVADKALVETVSKVLKHV